MQILPGKRKGTWRVIIWHKRPNENRSRAQEWTVEGKKSDAETFGAKKKIELGQSQNREIRIAPNFSSFCLNHYAPHAVRHLKPRSYLTAKYQLATLEKFFGPSAIDKISAADYERYKAWRQSAEKFVGNRNINSELVLCGVVLGYARTLGIDAKKFTWKRLPVRDGRVRVWTRDEIDRLFAAAREHAPEFLPILIFLLNTGCRKGEAIAAEWSWIDFDAGMIRIPVNEYWSPKSGRPREITMSDAVRAVLAGPRKHERWVFPSAWGRQHRKFPHHWFWAARDAAGLKGGIHTTRHTFASHFLAATKDIGALAEILGHSHTRTTEIYAHLLPGRLEETRNAVNLSPAISPVYKRRKKSTA